MPDSCSKCKTTDLPNSIIENTLLSVLNGVLTEKSVAEVVPVEDLIVILHRGTDLLQNEPMLLEFDFGSGVIVGDLHGSFIDLLSVIQEAGAPPTKKYLFLGDYVDRGTHQIETFLFVLLMKLRWPKRVYMLRGNHELYDTNVSNEFTTVCKSTYADDDVYPFFSRLFDVLPVAAILNGDTLCCHGGISQWMTSRDVIRCITRPTYLARMKLLENCLLCDILWADYVPTLDRPFVPSIRGSSFAFNRMGLVTILEGLQCKRLIRAHQPFRGGAVENCKGICYTVHTVPVFNREFHGAYMWTIEDFFGEVKYNLRPHNLALPSKVYTITNFTQSVNRVLLASFEQEYEVIYDTPGNKQICTLCMIQIPPLNKKARLISHTELVEWVHENAREIVEKHKVFDEIEEDDEFDPRQLAMCFVGLFPVAFDIVNLKGGTYRRGLHIDEWEFIAKWHPDAKYEYKAWPLEMSDAVLNLEPRAIALDKEHDVSVARAVQTFEDVGNSSGSTMITKVEIKDVKKRKAVFAKILHFFRRRHLSVLPTHRKKK